MVQVKLQYKTFLLLVFVLVPGITSIISCSSGINKESIGLNQNIHHDDFEYAVTSFEKRKILISGDDTIKAAGNFYLVHFRVINKALRVNHQWDNSIGFIAGEKGKRYGNSKNLQIFLDKESPFGWKELYNTPHGQTETTILVFDIPDDLLNPYLMVSGEILMGDVFDAGKFLKKKVRLF